MNSVQVIAFDADDTLWENEPLFREAERRWAEILSDYGSLEDLSARLFEVEKANMEDFGFGAKSFTLSLIETAISVTGGRLTARQTAEILAAGRSILHNPARPLPGVARTLTRLRPHYRLVLLTKGELLDQEHKVERSGLAPFFERIVIVSDKSEQAYRRLLDELDVPPEAFMMVGNSFKSDIRPVLELGGWGVHIPFHITWELEKTEEYPHERLYKLEHFEDLMYICKLD